MPSNGATGNNHQLPHAHDAAKKAIIIMAVPGRHNRRPRAAAASARGNGTRSVPPLFRSPDTRIVPRG